MWIVCGIMLYRFYGKHGEKVAYTFDAMDNDDFSFNFDDLFPNEDDSNSGLSNSNFSLINKETNEKILIYNCKADNDYDLDYENGEAIFEFYIKRLISEFKEKHITKRLIA